MVNPGVDGYTKPQTNGKISEKDNLLKTKRILKSKDKVGGGLVFTFSWPAEPNRPSSLPPAPLLQQTL